MKQETIRLRDGRVIIMPTPEEDAAITKAAMEDPDCPPLTDEDFAQALPAAQFYQKHPHLKPQKQKATSRRTAHKKAS